MKLQVRPRTASRLRWAIPAAVLLAWWAVWFQASADLAWDQWLAAMALMSLAAVLWERLTAPDSQDRKADASEATAKAPSPEDPLPAWLRMLPGLFLQWVMGAVLVLGVYATLVVWVGLAVVGLSGGDIQTLIVFQEGLRVLDDVALVAGIGASLCVAIAALLRYQVKAREAAERDRQLAQAELAVLRAQIEPHFLWNTLANVQFLTRRDPAAAESMIGHLVTYLRSCVPQGRKRQATLGDEAHSVQAYLELMKLRMGARLQVEVCIDPGLEGFEMPPLLMHTLVENAIKHGLEPKVGPCRLEVRAVREGEHVVVRVQDNGVGLSASPRTRGTGVGLVNSRERLKALYGTRASLQLEPANGEGTVVRLSLPAEGHRSGV